SVTVYNDPAQTLTVRLYEKGTTNPIAGAVYLLRDSGGTLIGADNGRFTTNASGEFSITGLTPGATITATQTATVSGFVIDTAPQSILIQSGEAQTLVFENARKGMLTIVKRDAATDEPLQGAEFKVTTVQGVPNLKKG
ncbi:MAG: hypothetical protein IJT94_00940, partial [Oscillibacter sp.]|nr:hypothetical protein [Oscillibacter sp.]